MNVGIYVRVSTQEQAQNGHSIDEQTDRAVKYCAAMRWDVSRIYTDPGFSGASLDRPGVRQLVADCEAKRLDKVLVYKLDRLSRSQRDTLHLIEDVFLKNGVDFVSMTESFDTGTAFGRAMIGILSVFAQLEREQIKERMEMGRVARAKEGLFCGGYRAPFGYDYTGGQLVVNDFEAAVVREIFDRLERNESTRSIVNDLNDRGLARPGGIWTSGYIRRVARNQAYIGNVSLRDAWYKGMHDPIISEDQFAAVQAVMSRRAEEYAQYNRRAGKAGTVLGGFLTCAQCGAKYSLATFKKTLNDGTVTRYQYYICSRKNGRVYRPDPSVHCHNKNWGIEELTAAVFGEIKKLALDPDYIAGYPSAERDLSAHAEAIRGEIMKTEEQIGRMLDLYTAGNIPVTAVQNRIAALNDRRRQLETELEETEKKINDRPTADEAAAIARTFEDVLRLGTFDQIRAVIADLIRKIELDEDTVTIYWRFA